MSDSLELRASSFGSCIRRQVALVLGMSELPPNDTVQGWYDRGIAHEDACVAAMAFTWSFPTDDVYICPGSLRVLAKDQGQWYFDMANSEWSITGHLDAIGTDSFTQRAHLIEIKAPATYARFEKAYKTANWSDPYMSQIAWQTSVYMNATGMECVMASWTEEDGLKTFGIEMPVFDLGQVYARVDEIHDWYALGELPPTCSQDDGWTCPVRYLHETPAVVDDPVLNMLAESYTDLGDAIKRLDATRAAVRDKLLEHGSGVTESYKVTVFEAANPPRWDEAAMIADGVDVAKYKTVKKGPRVKVTKKGSSDAATE